MIIFQMFIDKLHFIYVGNVRPFKTKITNNLNTVNEFIVLNLTVQLCLFTDFCGIPSA